MILASIHNIFDGEELLPYSVRSIKEHVDIRIGVTQSVSNTGQHYTPCYEHSLFDHIIVYEPNLLQTAAWNELKKRNIGLQFAKTIGATHFIGMDCDEIYDPEEFYKWKKYLCVNKYDVTLCKMLTYYREPTLRLDPIEDYYVPFICKINSNTRHSGIKYKYLCDPTRRVAPASRILAINDPLMHHFSFVRKNILRKFENSSSTTYQKHAKDLAKKFLDGDLIHFNGHSLVECDNIFNIKLC